MTGKASIFQKLVTGKNRQTNDIKPRKCGYSTSFVNSDSQSVHLTYRGSLLVKYLILYATTLDKHPTHLTYLVL